jgi:trimeric autotransporter adhesin
LATAFNNAEHESEGIMQLIKFCLVGLFAGAMSMPIQADSGALPFAPTSSKGANADGWIDFGGLRNGCNGAIQAIAIGSQNEVYIGGEFTLCGDTQVNRVARFDLNTQTWSSLGSGASNGLNGTAFSIALSGNTVIVGGNFNSAGGAPANFIARFDTTSQTWASLGTGLGSGPVYALAVASSVVYVGGAFTQAGGINANRVARFDLGTQTWASLGSGAANGLNFDVYALGLAGNALVVAGAFDRAGGELASRVARFDLTSQTWASLGSGVNGQVLDLAISGDALFVAGEFVQAGGAPASRVARFDLGTGAWSNLGSGLNDDAATVTVSGNTVVVGGLFTEAGGASANAVARFDLGSQSWSSLGSGASNGVNLEVFDLATSGSAVYVGGDFTQAGVLSANAVARFDLSVQSWTGLGNGSGNGINASVTAFAASGNTVYAGGFFSAAGGAAANRVARFDTVARTWSSLGSGASNGVNDTVAALAVSGNSVFVGGLFSQAGGIPANRIARFDLTTQSWAGLGSGITGGSVSALAVVGDTLYVGGSFSQAGGVPANNVARFDIATQTWSSVGSGAANGVNGVARSFAVFGNTVYVSGNFLQAGGVAVNALARFDLGTQTWSAVGSGLNGAVTRMAASGSMLYIVGSFTLAGGLSANRVARFDTATQTYASLGAGANATVRSVAVSGNAVYVGGDFTQAGGLPASRVARFDLGPQTWSSLGNGAANGIEGTLVNAVGTGTDGTVYVGGVFLRAGAELSLNIAGYRGDSLFRNGFE